MKKFGPDWPRSCSDTFGEEWKQRHSLPRCLDFEQVLASSRCTASFRHNHGTVCRAVLDVLQVLASSHCTTSCRRNHGTLCRAVLDVLQVLASFFALFTASFPHNHGTLCRAVLDVLQVSASSHCTASCRQNPAPCAALCCMACKCSHLRVALQVFVTITLCRAVLDVFQVFASSRSTGGFHHSNTLCRAVLDVSQMLASSRSTGPFCHRKASRPKCVRTTPSRICQNHSVHSQTKMFRLCLNIS